MGMEGWQAQQILRFPVSPPRQANGACHSSQRRCVLHLLEQLKHCQAKGICYDLHGIQGGIGVPILDPAQVGLVKAALFPELDLAPACL